MSEATSKNEALADLQERMSRHIDALLQCFKPGAKITVVVRNPEFDDADVVIGNDDLDEVVESVKKMKERPPDVRAEELGMKETYVNTGIFEAIVLQLRNGQVVARQCIRRSDGSVDYVRFVTFCGMEPAAIWSA